MAKVGRKPLMIPTTDWKIRIPVDLAAKADMLFLDPVRGNIQYGARSALVTELLRKHIDSLQKADDDVNSGAVNSPINPPL